MKVVELYGCHGTVRLAERSIRSEGFRMPRTGGLRGRGIYFWEFYPEHGLSRQVASELAVAWVKYAMSQHQYRMQTSSESELEAVVIDAKVVTGVDRFLDLVTQSETRTLFNQLLARQLELLKGSAIFRAQNGSKRKKLLAKLYDLAVNDIEEELGELIAVVRVVLRTPPQYQLILGGELGEQVAECIVVKKPEHIRLELMN